MKIIDANVCVTCDEVFEIKKVGSQAQRMTRACPSCGSEAMPLSLARIIQPLEGDGVMTIPVPSAVEVDEIEGVGV